MVTEMPTEAAKLAARDVDPPPTLEVYYGVNLPRLGFSKTVDSHSRCLSAFSFGLGLVRVPHGNLGLVSKPRSVLCGRSVSVFNVPQRRGFPASGHTWRLFHMLCPP